jgi:hypothetical protein
MIGLWMPVAEHLTGQRQDRHQFATLEGNLTDGRHGLRS